MTDVLKSLLDKLRGIKFKRRCWSISRPARAGLREFFFNGDIKVADGPFAGMSFLNEPVWGSITPKWLGCYEAPLWSPVESIIKRKPGKIIDVGCAEGYYAAGFAYRLRDSIVHAFDADRHSMAQTAKLAQLNGLERQVVVRNWCSHESITNLSAEGTGLLFCDIEGGEEFLLDIDACPSLAKWEILVEVHPLRGSIEAMSEVLTRRFTNTHSIERIEDRKPQLADFPRISSLGIDAELFQASSNEGRPWQQHWLWMLPR